MINLSALKENIDLEIEASKKESADTFRCGMLLAEIVSEALEQQIAADVVEVKHGEWLMPLTDEPWRKGYFCRCSVCKYINRGHTLMVPNFCENCGTIMDGERRTDNG